MKYGQRLLRAFRHSCYDVDDARRVLPNRAMHEIEAAIAAGEARHGVELRFVVEASLDWPAIWARATPRERALRIFSALRIWDTEANNGVLLYVLMADKAVEIIADRAVARVVAQSEWQRVCDQLTIAYRAGNYSQGTLAAVQRIHELVEAHFPPGTHNPNELPNQPLIV